MCMNCRNHCQLPTKEGYAFVGWFTDEWLTKKAIEGANISANTILYAKWTPIEYTITYNLDEGTVATENPEKYTLETDTFTLNNPTKPGYIFVGWTGTGIDSVSKTVTIAKGSTGDRTYTAELRENTEITMEWETDPLKPDHSYNKLIINGDARAYKSCLLYEVDDDGNETYCMRSDVSEAQTSGVLWDYVEGIKYKLYLSTTSDESGKKEICTSVRVASKAIYTITYNTNGGSEIEQAKRVAAIPDPLPKPTKKGYTFDGWFTDEALTEVATAGTEISEDVTLYAKWLLIEYTITYDLDEGTVATENPEIYTIETDTFTLNNPVRTGYTFEGWTGTGIDSTLETVTIDKGSIGDRSYRAKWIKNAEVTIEWESDPLEAGESWNKFRYKGDTSIYKSYLLYEIDVGKSEIYCSWCKVAEAQTDGIWWNYEEGKKYKLYLSTTEDASGKTEICTSARVAGNISHTHIYGAWRTDEIKHWHECMAIDCPNKVSSKIDEEAHIFGEYISNNDGTKTRICRVCGYNKTVKDESSKPQITTTCILHFDSQGGK